VHLNQLTHRAHAPVAQVVDVVRRILPGIDPDQRPHDLHQVLARQHAGVEPNVETQPLVQLVAPDLRQVVPARVEEEPVQERRGVLPRRRVARPQAPVKLDLGLLPRLRGVALQRALDEAVLRVVDVREELPDLIVVDDADGAQQHGHRQLPLSVDLDRQHVLVRRLELQPGAAAGDQLRHGKLAPGRRVGGQVEVDTGRAHQLRHDHPLGPVNEEGAVRGHDREVAEEDVAFLNLSGFADDELDPNPERRGVGHVALAAGLLIVARLVKAMLQEPELHLAVVVDDGRDLFEELAHPLRLEPLK